MEDEMHLDKTSIILSNGVTIITSCEHDQISAEINKNGIFTNFLLEALKGGAADLNGDISAANIYTYID